MTPLLQNAIDKATRWVKLGPSGGFSAIYGSEYEDPLRTPKKIVELSEFEDLDPRFVSLLDYYKTFDVLNGSILRNSQYLWRGVPKEQKINEESVLLAVRGYRGPLNEKEHKTKHVFHIEYFNIAISQTGFICGSETLKGSMVVPPIDLDRRVPGARLVIEYAQALGLTTEQINAQLASLKNQETADSTNSALPLEISSNLLNQ